MKLKDFRVSVIITSYNQKDYLIEAIESVLQQTEKPHEIIIADDCSTDRTIDVIQDYMAQYPGWVKGIFQKKNVGIPRNRNTALHQVTGNFVTILDGDDRFLPHKLEREKQALEQFPAARCVYSNVYLINRGGEVIGQRDGSWQPSGDVFVEVAKGYFGILRSMLIDYALLQQIGFLDERFPSYDGFELTVRLAKKCQFAYVEEPLLENRVHDVSYQTAMKANHHLRDLEVIYAEMGPMLSELPATQQEEIVKTWYLRFLRFRLRDALERRNLVTVCRMMLSESLKGQLHLRDWRQIISLATPIAALKSVRSLHS